MKLTFGFNWRAWFVGVGLDRFVSYSHRVEDVPLEGSPFAQKWKELFDQSGLPFPRPKRAIPTETSFWLLTVVIPVVSVTLQFRKRTKDVEITHDRTQTDREPKITTRGPAA